jgi:hypothetical protein
LLTYYSETTRSAYIALGAPNSDANKAAAKPPTETNRTMAKFGFTNGSAIGFRVPDGLGGNLTKDYDDNLDDVFDHSEATFEESSRDLYTKADKSKGEEDVTLTFEFTVDVVQGSVAAVYDVFRDDYEAILDKFGYRDDTDITDEGFLSNY